jgi:hypothetical protein
MTDETKKHTIFLRRYFEKWSVEEKQVVFRIAEDSCLVVDFDISALILQALIADGSLNILFNLRPAMGKWVWHVDVNNSIKPSPRVALPTTQNDVAES